MADEKDGNVSKNEDDQEPDPLAEDSESSKDTSEDESEEKPVITPIEEPKKILGIIPVPSKKVMIIIFAVSGFLVIGGIGFGLYSMGFLNSLLGIEYTGEEERIEKSEQIILGTPIYYEQPEFVTDLKTGECRGSLIKLSLTIQIEENDEDILIIRQPKIIDRIQQHLRSQTKQDLSGKDGADKLRNELVRIVNGTIKPAKVVNILFRSFIIQ